MATRVSVAALVLLPLLLLAGSRSARRAERPNFVYILADDLGYMDVTSYAARTLGVERSECYYETPHLNRLADDGLAFTAFYASSVCSPTRAQILTGKYPARLGIVSTCGGETFFSLQEETPKGWHPHDSARGTRSRNAPLLTGTKATVLQSGHLPEDVDELTLAEALAEEGYRSGFIGKWHIGGQGADGYQPRDHGFEEIAYFDRGSSPYFDWAEVWESTLGERRRGDPGASPTKEEYLTDELARRAADWIRERAETPDEPFFLYLCHFAVHTPLQAKAEDIEYFEAKENRGWNEHEDATYAAMVKSLDDSVGEILDTLDETGLAKNTVVIFQSDNGGLETHWGEREKRITSNGPFRGGKSTLYEGGIRVPFIVRWPERTPPGRLCEIVVDACDVFPTLIELARASDDGAADRDGESLATLLTDPTNAKKTVTRDTRFWHNGLGAPTPRTAIRKKDHKLIYYHGSHVELYDLATDPHEESDLARAEPERTKALLGELVEWLEEEVPARYLPAPNPQYSPDVKSPYPPYRDVRKEILGG